MPVTMKRSIGDPERDGCQSMKNRKISAALWERATTLAVWAVLSFHANSAIAAELLVAAQGQIGPTWDRGIAAFDAQNDYNSCFNDSGAACPNVNWRWLGDSTERFLRLQYPGTGILAGVYFKASVPQDFSAFTGGVVEFYARSSEPSTDLTVKIDCNHPCSTGDIRLNGVLSEDWRKITLNVDDLIARGLDITAVDTGLVLWPTALGEVNVDIKDIVWRMTPEAAASQRGTGGPILLLENLEGAENTSPNDYAGLKQVWADEFNQDQIDLGSWNFDIGGWGWGNDELQYYLSDKATLADGHLVITAREQQFEDRNYTSTRIKTEGEVEFTYGRVDIRAALPKGQGIWPALWSLGANFREVGWPYTGELDIMEMIGGSGREDTIHGTLHWNVGGLNTPYAHTYQGGDYRLPSGEFSDGFHVFSMIREPDRVRWLVDDVQYYSFSLTSERDFDAFRLPFFLIFNIAVGGRWPGYPNDSTSFPQRMVVDYVRIFAAKSASEDSDGDGVVDPDDDLPLDPDESLDTDGDGIGNNEDSDDDGDGVADVIDVFPQDPSEWADSDGDGIGDNAQASVTPPSTTKEVAIWMSALRLMRNRDLEDSSP